MGSYVIEIKGTGCHHNGKPEIDADQMAKKLLSDLRAAAHNNVSGTITVGDGPAEQL